VRHLWCIAQTQDNAEKRKGEGYDYTDWYFSKKAVK